MVKTEQALPMRTEKEKMLAGELYDASAPEIQAELAATHRWLALQRCTRHGPLRPTRAANGTPRDCWSRRGNPAAVPLRLRLQYLPRRWRLPELQLRDPRCCRGYDRRPHSDRSGGADPRGRPSARAGLASLWPRIRASGEYRAQCLDWG